MVAVEKNLAEWSPQAKDYAVFDLQNNEGYLFHISSGAYLKFPIISGRQDYVYNLGRVYWGETPLREWEVKSTHLQPDRWDYGQDGFFLRLYFQNQFTHYGIHTHTAAKTMFKKQNRYQSYGCIIVKEEILELLNQTYLLNNQSLKVVTTDNIAEYP